MSPDRLAAFGELFAVAVLQGIMDLKMHTAGLPAEEAAYGITLDMLGTIERRGVHAVEHYLINTRGGAFRRTAAALGVDPTAKGLQAYLEG